VEAPPPPPPPRQGQAACARCGCASDGARRLAMRSHALPSRHATPRRCSSSLPPRINRVMRDRRSSQPHDTRGGGMGTGTHAGARRTRRGGASGSTTAPRWRCARAGCAANARAPPARSRTSYNHTRCPCAPTFCRCARSRESLKRWRYARCSHAYGRDRGRAGSFAPIAHSGTIRRRWRTEFIRFIRIHPIFNSRR